MSKRVPFILVTAAFLVGSLVACESPVGPTSILLVEPPMAYLGVGDSTVLNISGGHFQNNYSFTPDISSMTCCRVEEVAKNQIRVTYLNSIHTRPVTLFNSSNYYSVVFKVHSGNGGPKSQNIESKIYFTN